MKINYKKIVAFGLLVASTFVQARDFGTPLTIWRGRGYEHYPLRPIDPDACWNIDVWGAGLHRDTNGAFGNKESTKTGSLSGLLFGQDAFVLTNAFVPGSFSATNPFLSFIQFTPSFNYTENAAIFGFIIERTFGCDNEWYGGLRLQLPVVSIRTELDSCCQLAETIDDVRIQRIREIVPNEAGAPRTVEDSFAYRLDFLAALPMEVNAPTDRLVKFSDPAAGGDITINNIDITDRPALDLNKNPVTIYAIDSGAVPPSPFSLRQTANTGVLPDKVLPLNLPEGLPFADSTASNIASGTRGRFSQSGPIPITGINYAALATNAAAQRRLWVVPTVATQGVAPNEVFGLVPSARSIQTATEAVLQGLNQSAINFLTAAGISFNSQTAFGAGDLDAEFYGGRTGCNWFAEAALGFKFPTGKRNKTPLLLLAMPTGNNGHVEVRLGGIGGWNPCDWFALKADAFYSFVLRRTESLAAPFAGATIRNIGPAIDGKVSWGYFVGDLDATFIVPCWPAVGVDIGYQIYAKHKDDISFGDVTTATDLFGTTQTLDATVLETGSNSTAHRVKTEIFHQGCDWHLYAGWSHVFAGKNVTMDTDYYIGFGVYF